MSKPNPRVVKLADLVPDSRNANKGTLRGLAMLDDSLREDGAGRGILLDRNNNIIAGNKTVERAIDDGFEEIIVVPTDGKQLVATQRVDVDLDSPQGRRMGLRDNRIAQVDLEFDPDVLKSLQDDGVDLSSLWDADELAELLASVDGGTPAVDPGAQTDRAEELQAKWQVLVGETWRIPSKTAKGEHRIVCGDCTDRAVVERVMRGERADCVFTSPPYAVGIDYGVYEDTIANLRAMLPKLSKLWLDVVVDGGFAVINFGDIAPASDVANTTEPCEYPMAVEYWPVFRADGWLLWSRRIWCKPNERVNSMWCIQSNRAATDWEHIWTWRKPGDAIIRRVDGEYRSPRGWYQSSHAAGVEVGKDVHGAGMALSIAEWMLTVHSRPKHVVFEPFAGTGTTIVAAERLGRRCHGTEVEPKSCAVILERLAGLGLSPERVQ